MKYFCYIYFSPVWRAYYVGKGSNEVRIKQRHEVKTPSDLYIQVLWFNNEWEALECERELIAFWGRKCDGGCLENKAIGGTVGPTGYKYTKEQRRKRSTRMKGQSTERMTAVRRIPVTLHNVETGEVRLFVSQMEARREIGIHGRIFKKGGISKNWTTV